KLVTGVQTCALPIFEIHPVTTVKVGGQVIDATKAIGATPGFTPHKADEAFLPGYEKLTCTIIPKKDRTRIITEASKFNFTDFVRSEERRVGKEWRSR